MPPSAALALCGVCVLILFAADLRWRPSTSYALWVPTVWLFLIGSRPVSRWLNPFSGEDFGGGSFSDRVVLSSLLLLGVVVLARRKIEWSRVLRNNFWLILFFLFIGLSVTWTDSPYIAFKRWTRSATVIVMALMVMSEADPLYALERLLRRCAYIAIPLSIVFIRYFPAYGRSYGRWSGLEMWTGITTQKNSLGQLCAVSVFVLVCSLFRKYSGGRRAPSRLAALLDLTVILGAIWILRGSEGGIYSATATAIMVIGVATFVSLYCARFIARGTVALLHGVVLGTALVYVALGESLTEFAATTLGRDPDLTSRASDIWPAVLEM